MFLDFFRELFRSRVKLVESRVRGKVVGVQAQARGKVASKFNAVIDKPMDAASRAVDKKSRDLKNRAKGVVPSGGGANSKSPQAKADSGKASGGGRAGSSGGASSERRGFMGLFRSKNKSNARETSRAEAPQAAMSDDGATQVIDVSSFQDDRSFDVVGWLVPLNGVDRGRDFRLRTGKNIIGTAADCDIVITDPYMSAKHAAVIHQNGIFTLIDLGSTNGTSLNDRPVQKEELIDNDTVRVGRTELKFKSLF
jgi:hypothetical protein